MVILVTKNTVVIIFVSKILKLLSFWVKHPPLKISGYVTGPNCTYIKPKYRFFSRTPGSSLLSFFPFKVWHYFAMFLNRLYLNIYSIRWSWFKLMKMETNNSSTLSSSSSCKAQKISARSLASEASDSAGPSSPKPTSQRKCCHHGGGGHHNSHRNNSGVYFRGYFN